ncbi:putative hemolysin [Burkholderia sp. TSV86]|uniref:putative hemolysin n=1 Tax=Burkholderia sp. TSV86 TaxID=1385594 RepID=UPI00075E41BE|nr:DUF333 domain-containing protein [Burkholderia sp. TSV86]KVE39199.1 hypothetical protein WS68_20570 [Burkholderia sp. TSV86]
MFARSLRRLAWIAGIAPAFAQPQPAAPDAAHANPASVHCEKLGGKVAIHDSAHGQYGVCVFKDGRECDEWVLYRDGRCVPLDARGWPIAARSAKPASK